jgi:predicted amidohydrolase YtcJ
MNLYADLLFTGGAVYTADSVRPWAEAVAVRDGRILAVGSAAELAELQGPSTVVTNLAGKLLLPGFTESHVHFIELSFRVAQVDATEARDAGGQVFGHAFGRGSESRGELRCHHYVVAARILNGVQALAEPPL